MKKYISVGLMLLLGASNLVAYPVNTEATQQQQETVGVPAEFPGGKEAMMKFIEENLQYPEAARQAGVSGRVTLEFTVHVDGSISDITLFENAKNTDNADLIAEAKRVVGLFPKFTPATMDGQPFESRFVVPIRFKGGAHANMKSDVNAAKTYTDEKGRTVVEPDFANQGAMGLRKYLFRPLVIDPHEKYYNEMAGATIVLELTIDKEGNTDDVDIISSTCKRLNERAEKIGEQMPKWKPGTIDGKPTKMKRKLTLHFEGMRGNQGPMVIKK